MTTERAWIKWIRASLFYKKKTAYCFLSIQTVIAIIHINIKNALFFKKRRMLYIGDDYFFVWMKYMVKVA